MRIGMIANEKAINQSPRAVHVSNYIQPYGLQQ